MDIGKNAVVYIDYTLKDDNGETLDSSSGGEPLAYLHGVGQLVAGLETELEGKGIGDVFAVSVTAAEGYGEFEKDLIIEVPKERFEGDGEISEGTQVQAQQEDGTVQVFTITQVEGKNVTLDGNHPLAGQTLHFDIEVKDVREASAEELDHGHVH